MVAMSHQNTIGKYFKKNRISIGENTDKSKTYKVNTGKLNYALLNNTLCNNAFCSKWKANTTTECKIC